MAERYFWNSPSTGWCFWGSQYVKSPDERLLHAVSECETVLIYEQWKNFGCLDYPGEFNCPLPEAIPINHCKDAGEPTQLLMCWPMVNLSCQGWWLRCSFQGGHCPAATRGVWKAEFFGGHCEKREMGGTGRKLGRNGYTKMPWWKFGGEFFFWGGFHWGPVVSLLVPWHHLVLLKPCRCGLQWRAQRLTGN